ncbi:MAG TPA: DUF2383 domain-containing protein [Pedobacter sp.]|jgi:uncharacterized protein (TIGR02284 family)
MEAAYHENYIKQLQRLLNSVIESQKKYIDAADHIDSADFKNLFNRYADERTNMISELKDAIQKLSGSTPDVSAADVNSHHFNSTHTTTDTKKDQEILSKLRNSEKDALDVYDDILQGSILEVFNLKTLIMSQRLTISNALTEIDQRYFDLYKLKQPY